MQTVKPSPRGRPTLKGCIKCLLERNSPYEFNPRYPLYCLTCKPFNPVVRPSRVKQVDLTKELDKLLTCLHREIKSLLVQSRKGPLKRERATTLIHYTKLVAELRAQRMLEDVDRLSIGDEVNE